MPKKRAVKRILFVGGELDLRWLFINANNTPRIARVDLGHKGTFKTEEVLEIPNSA